MSLLLLGDPIHMTVKGRKCSSFYISLFSDLSVLFRPDVEPNDLRVHSTVALLLCVSLSYVWGDTPSSFSL